MPTTYAVPNGATAFAATTYTGTGTTQSILNSANTTTGVSFQPDFVWLKVRSTTGSNYLFDSIRGVGDFLTSDNTNAESTNSQTLTSFNSNGFTLGTAGGAINGSGSTFIGWNWKAGGTSSSNTNGSITSTVSVNATAGFSIVTATCPASAGTVGHGLGVTPSLIIFKDRTNGTNYWIVWHSSLASATQGYMELDSTSAYRTSVNAWNNTAPTSTTFSTPVVGVGPINSGDTFVAYCWAQIPGYSKFGSYTGNGSADGPFVFTNFRPRWVMIKRTDTTANWIIWDTSRDTYNVTQNDLFPNSSAAEVQGNYIDILSNGFKNRDTSVTTNASGGTYIYAAFAETAFKFSNAR